MHSEALLTEIIRLGGPSNLSENIVCLKKKLKQRAREHGDKPSSSASETKRTDYIENATRNNDEKFPKHHDEINIMVDLALDICKVTKKLNKHFSGILFCCYGGNLFISTLSFYTSILCLCILSFSTVHLGWGLMNGFCFILYMSRLYFVTISGHDLGQSMKSLRLEFKSYIIWTEESKMLEIHQDENGILRNKIDLMNDLLSNESPISPYGYFSITGGAFLSALTTIITYLIVLIQFKISE